MLGQVGVHLGAHAVLRGLPAPGRESGALEGVLLKLGMAQMRIQRLMTAAGAITEVRRRRSSAPLGRPRGWGLTAHAPRIGQLLDPVRPCEDAVCSNGVVVRRGGWPPAARLGVLHQLRGTCRDAVCTIALLEAVL